MVSSEDKPYSVEMATIVVLSRKPCQEDCRHCSRLDDKIYSLPFARVILVVDGWIKEEIQANLERDQFWNGRPSKNDLGEREIANRSPKLKRYCASGIQV